MFEYLMNIYKTYSEFTSSNQMLGAVVAGLIMSAGVFLFRSIPKKIYTLIYNRTVTSIQFNSQVDWQQKEACKILLSWANQYKTLFYSRSSLPTFMQHINPNNHEEANSVMSLGLGIGKSLIKYKNNFYIVNVDLQKASETMTFNFNVSLRCFWFQSQNLQSILMELFEHKDDNALSIHEWNRDWSRTNVPHRQINTAITTDNIGEKIIDICRDFINDKDWYYKTGISYKLGICLYGSPGTGKTSLVKAMATELKRSLYSLNIATTTDSSFINAVRAIPAGSILSLEDIDCAVSSAAREVSSDKNKENNGKDPSLSLSTILNVLDGVVPLNNIIIVMSTNHVDKIDPAILRKGRSDYMIEIKPLDTDAVSRFSQFVYGQPISFKGNIKGCDLQHLIIEHKKNFYDFSKALSNLGEVAVLKQDELHGLSVTERESILNNSIPRHEYREMLSL